MREYSRGLSGFFRSRRCEKAEDLVHDTLVACLGARERLREPRAMRSYTYRAARLILARDIDRHGCVRSSGDLDGEAPDGKAERPELSFALREAMEELPPTHAEAVVLYYYGGYRAPEIAVRLGVPEGTVRSRIRRGVARLRRSLTMKQGSAPKRPRPAL